MKIVRKAVTTFGGIFLAALFIAALAPTVSKASEFTYAVDQSLPGGGSIVGDITTNGTQGSLGYIEIDSWSFGVSADGNTGTSNGTHAGKVNLSGLDVSATPISLKFNFGGVDGGELIFPVSNGGYVVWATADCQVCASIAGVSGGFVAAVDIGGDGVADVLSLSGVQTIGTAAATPEPATSGLMLIGVALLAMMIAMRTRMFQFGLNGLS
jgi:hypothetical protein